jgi:hypothetical protein
VIMRKARSCKDALAETSEEATVRVASSSASARRSRLLLSSDTTQPCHCKQAIYLYSREPPLYDALSQSQLFFAPWWYGKFQQIELLPGVKVAWLGSRSQQQLFRDSIRLMKLETMRMPCEVGVDVFRLSLKMLFHRSKLLRTLHGSGYTAGCARLRHMH